MGRVFDDYEAQLFIALAFEKAFQTGGVQNVIGWFGVWPHLNQGRPVADCPS